MGLLDQLAGQVTRNVGAQQQDAVPGNELLNGVMGLINGAGGLPALLQKLKDSGLQDQVASWVGTGENHAVSVIKFRVRWATTRCNKLRNRQASCPSMQRPD